MLLPKGQGWSTDEGGVDGFEGTGGYDPFDCFFGRML